MSTKNSANDKKSDVKQTQSKWKESAGRRIGVKKLTASSSRVGVARNGPKITRTGITSPSWCKSQPPPFLTSTRRRPARVMSRPAPTRATPLSLKTPKKRRLTQKKGRKRNSKRGGNTAGTDPCGARNETKHLHHTRHLKHTTPGRANPHLHFHRQSQQDNIKHASVFHMSARVLG